MSLEIASSPDSAYVIIDSNRGLASAGRVGRSDSFTVYWGPPNPQSLEQDRLFRLTATTRPISPGEVDRCSASFGESLTVTWDAVRAGRPALNPVTIVSDYAVRLSSKRQVRVSVGRTESGVSGDFVIHDSDPSGGQVLRVSPGLGIVYGSEERPRAVLSYGNEFAFVTRRNATAIIGTEEFRETGRSARLRLWVGPPAATDDAAVVVTREPFDVAAVTLNTELKVKETAQVGGNLDVLGRGSVMRGEVTTSRLKLVPFVPTDTEREEGVSVAAAGLEWSDRQPSSRDSGAAATYHFWIRDGWLWVGRRPYAQNEFRSERRMGSDAKKLINLEKFLSDGLPALGGE